MSINLSAGYDVIYYPHHEEAKHVTAQCAAYFKLTDSIKQEDVSNIIEHRYHTNARRECYVVRDHELPETLSSSYELFQQTHALGRKILRQIESDWRCCKNSCGEGRCCKNSCGEVLLSLI